VYICFWLEYPKSKIMSTIGTHDIVEYAINKSLGFDLFTVGTHINNTDLIPKLIGLLFITYYYNNNMYEMLHN